ncbi:MAG: HAD family hydrolase [Chloroflexota bacterium]
MIKAVFFDWFNTLAHYEPSREELQSQVLQEFGIHISPQQVARGILTADRNYFEENAASPVRKRSPEEQAKIYVRYQQIILTESGVDIPREPDILLKIMKRAQELSQGMKFTLFNDVLPTVKKLKQQNLTLGLLTNLDREMKPICHELGLESYIDFIVTSGEVGADKPKPPIFLAALQKAGVTPPEAMHVGDQYQLDVVGARGTGINPILLDRYDQYTEINDCPRIHSLTEVTAYVS